MREIKFRGKDSDTGKWRYGYYVRHEKVTLCLVYDNKEEFEKDVAENTEHYIIFDGSSDWNMSRALYRADVDGKTVGQYTGMKDCNGTEIYEGDIVVVGYDTDNKCDRYIMTFNDDSHSYLAKQQGTLGSYIGSGYWNDKLVVIGNRWDNPELLGGAHDEH